MTVYVDNARIRKGGGNWSHMTADTRAELDRMADIIGLDFSWIQYPDTWKEHYDVTDAKGALAIRNGAVAVDAYEHVESFLIPRKIARGE